jgi:hypothetical protein
MLAPFAAAAFLGPSALSVSLKEAFLAQVSEVLMVLIKYVVQERT